MKKHFFLSRLPLLCLCAAAMSFTACGEEEEDTLPPDPGIEDPGSGGEDPGSGSEEPDAGVIPTMTDPITAIEDRWGELHEYVYDAEGRLLYGNDLYEPFNIAFSPLAFHVGVGTDVQQEWSPVSTNADGYITQAVVAASDIYDGVYGHYEIRVEYDADGFLSRWDLSGVEDSVAFTDNYTFEYADGNLRRIVCNYSDPEYGDAQEIYTYTYASAGTYPNTGIPFYEENLGTGEPFMFLGGYMGRFTRDLPVAVSEVYKGEDVDGPYESTEERHFEWTYDGQGRVATFTERDAYGNTGKAYTYHYGGVGTDSIPSASAKLRPAAGAGVTKRPDALRERIRTHKAALMRR